MKTWSAAWLPLFAVGVIGLAGCGDDEGNGGTPPPPPQDLSGTYELVSISQAGITLQCPAMGCSGTLTLTATTYTLELNVPDPTDPLGPPDVILDMGTYTTNGNQWTQDSTQGLGQSVGTFTFDGSTLTVDATSAGVQVVTVWNKTS